MSSTFAGPDGFTPLATIADHGDDKTWGWTTQQVAYRAQPTAGPTGPLASMLTGTPREGLGWDVGLAIAPAP